MKFKCIKTVDFSWYGENSVYRYPFIEGKIYKYMNTTTRTQLNLINEIGLRHSIGTHWLHWKFNSFFKEHFIKIKD